MDKNKRINQFLYQVEYLATTFPWFTAASVILIGFLGIFFFKILGG